MTNEEFIKRISLDGEEWRDIIGFEGLYKVSSLGRVVSLSKYVNNRFKDVYKEPRLMIPHNNGNSTQSVMLSKRGKDKKVHIPVLVASAFLPNPKNCKSIRMIDGNNRNYHVSNLEWVILKDRRKHQDITPLKGEEWRDVPGYEGLYKVSSEGRIMSSYSKKLLTPVKSGPKGKDYYAITLVKDGFKKRFYIHKLVALAFIPNPQNLPCIDHLNTDRYDNRYRNLRWCSFSDNNLNPNTAKKRYQPIVRLKNGQLQQIYESITSATSDGFHSSCIIACCRNKIKSHRGFCWMYLSDYKTLVSMSKSSHPNGCQPQ